MRKLLVLILCLSVSVIINDIYAQNKSETSGKVQGLVRDQAGQPLVGASIIIKGTTIGTVANDNGFFTIQAQPNSVLVISMLGYESKEIQVGSKTSLKIVLAEDLKTLDEVVVVGYGVQKKKDLTGSVAVVSGDKLQQRNAASLSTALQGASSGVLVTRDGNAPGATATIRVRGVTTIGDSDPLYIIDGVPGDINAVNLDDVESMSVLKDAASASIYGSRAAAGVILIQTKRAAKDQVSVNYNVKLGFEIPTKQPTTTGLIGYLKGVNEGRYNDNPDGGFYQTYSEELINNWLEYNKNNPDEYPNTDWSDLILASKAFRQSHSITVSGRSQTVQTRASFNYDDVDGLYKINNMNWNRIMMRVNNDVKITKWMSASVDFNFRHSTRKTPHFSPLAGPSSIRKIPPIYAAVWSDGRLAEGKAGDNPYGALLYGGDKKAWTDQIGGKISLDITPVDGLKLSAVIAPQYNFARNKNFKRAVEYSAAEDPTRKSYITSYNTTSLEEIRGNDNNYTLQFLATYLKDFGKHSINALAGYEEYYAYRETMSGSGDNYQLDYPYLDLAPSDMLKVKGSATENAYRSWFGRIGYSYGNKYLLQVNLRADASSRFHRNYRWGFFPSVSAGWVITQENFMKSVDPKILTFAKLRASWGQLGNERMLDASGNPSYYPYQSSISFYEALFFNKTDIVTAATAAQTTYAVRDVTWETTSSVDVGVDLSFLNGRLSATADYYKKTTSDMLLALQIPTYIGYENPRKNTGEMYSEGYDIELSWRDDVNEKFRYSVTVNLSDNMTKMGNLGGTEFLGNKIKVEGSAFDEWYGYKTNGLYLTQEDVDNSAKLNNSVRVGDIWYKDISGPEGVPDGKISPEYDRVRLGPSLPRYIFGGNITLEYANFDFAMTFQGVGSQLVGVSGSDMVKPFNNDWGGIPSAIDGKYWSPTKSPEENAKAKYPALTFARRNANFETFSDLYLFNGRYFRLKNLTLGYTLPSKLTNKIYMKDLRIYVSADDVFCLSKFPKGWDPEMGGSSYPITTTLLLGLSVKF